MSPEFESYWLKVRHAADTLPPPRTRLLQEAAGAIIELVGTTASDDQNAQPVVLNFICTHNSRRSHLGQAFAQIAAHLLDIAPVRCVSGGTETTACNPRIIESLRRCGLAIETQDDDSANPRYGVNDVSGNPLVVLYSKIYDDPVNRSDAFLAMMCCSDADDACPIIPGATRRIKLHYLDPKISDDTPQEASTYDERRDQIAAEMHYLMCQVKQGMPGG